MKDYENVTVVPNPIAPVEYTPSSSSRTVLYLGYVVKTKGMEELVKAWKEIHEAYPEWKLRIVGAYVEEYKKNLNSIYSDDSIEYTGQKSHEEAMEELKNAGVFVLPSYMEGFPYSVCEAMFCGKAIVAANVGAIPVMLSDEAGILCKAKDVGSLVEKLRLVISDNALREKLGMTASIKANAQYAESVVMERYKAIWGCNKKDLKV